MMEGENCPICWEILQNNVDKPTFVQLACEHYFHVECLTRWLFDSLRVNNTCPNCRLPLMDEDRSRILEEVMAREIEKLTRGRYEESWAVGLHESYGRMLEMLTGVLLGDLDEITTVLLRVLRMER